LVTISIIKGKVQIVDIGAAQRKSVVGLVVGHTLFHQFKKNRNGLSKVEKPIRGVFHFPKWSRRESNSFLKLNKKGHMPITACTLNAFTIKLTRNNVSTKSAYSPLNW